MNLGHALGLTGLGLDTCPLSNDMYDVVVVDLWKPAWFYNSVSKDRSSGPKTLHFRFRVSGHLSAGLFTMS